MDLLLLKIYDIDDYDKLCNLHILGVQDIPKTHEETVHTTSKNNGGKMMEDGTKQDLCGSKVKRIFKTTKQQV